MKLGYLTSRRNHQKCTLKKDKRELVRPHLLNEDGPSLLFASTEYIHLKDETGISNVQKKSAKVYAKKGQKRVGTATSAERGRTITLDETGISNVQKKSAKVYAKDKRELVRPHLLNEDGPSLLFASTEYIHLKDETGISNVQKKSAKVYAKKGQRELVRPHLLNEDGPSLLFASTEYIHLKDETGISNQKKSAKVYAKKGQKRVGTATSA
ncbi:hypothetical protein J6590_087903 [Homalodisca vitripennis]|nr:hypothetical protein J6590_087903 [Homalodisca vitripennis]